MRRFGFVVQVLALLVGFYVMCAALVAGCVGLLVLAVRADSPRGAVLMFLLSLAAIYVVLRAVFVSTHLRARDIVGIEVAPAGQPALWDRVRELADQVGTRAPRRIFLVPDVNAAVWENTRLLGLVPGKRQLMVGIPLLIALTPAQMDAVLAHEMGHYGNRDTRLGGLVGRTRQSVLTALRTAGRQGRIRLPGSGVFVVLFRGYAKLVLRVTQGASRAQEYAADRVAARIAGPDNVIAALSELRAIDRAFDFYLGRYVAPGLRLGLMPPPPELFGGFAALLADPARQAEIDEIRRGPRQTTPDPFDSHPSMPERVAALEALPRNGSVPEPAGVRAIAILVDPADAVAQVAVRSLRKEVGGKQVASWDGLASALGLHRADERAEPLRHVVARLSGRPPHLGTLVDLAAAGRLTEVLDALPRNEASRRTNATGRVAREHAKTELSRMLRGWVVGDLVRTGRATWVHSWADVAGELRLAPELKAELDAAVEDFVAVRPDGTRLHALVSGPAVAA